MLKRKKCVSPRIILKTKRNTNNVKRERERERDTLGKPVVRRRHELGSSKSEQHPLQQHATFVADVSEAFAIN